MKGSDTMIGREEELNSLKKIFDKAMAGEGQTVMISGEAGIGKTRMVEELHKWASESGTAFSVGQCSENEISEPYHPFRAAFSSLGAKEVLSLEDYNTFDEFYLISKTGLLMTHLSNTEDEGIDEDILSSMLTAVQDFVKDSFGDGELREGGGLGKLEYRNKKVLLEHGEFVFLAAVVSGEEHKRMRSDVKKVLKTLEKDFQEILSDWDGDLDRVSGTQDLLQLLIDKKYPMKKTIESMNIEAERLKAQVKIQEVLENNSEKGIVLVIEDLHWADETSLLAIPYLARNIRSSKICLCCTFQPEDEGETNIASVLETMRMEKNIEDISLERLDREQVESLADNLLEKRGLPEGLAEKLTEGGGNPMFIIEAIRTLIRERILIKRDEIWIFRSEKGKALPTTVNELVTRQLETLNVESLQVVEFASVLGMYFDPEIICLGANVDQTKVENALNLLEDVNLIVPASGNEYSFKHGITQESVYSGVSDRWKAVLHKSAGESIEFKYEYDIDSVLFKLAYHYARTNEYNKGIEYSIEAGDKAANNYAPKEAAGFYEGAICLVNESGMDFPRHLDILMTLGELYDISAQYDRALDSYKKAEKMSKDDITTAKINKSVGFIYHNKGDYDKAIQHYKTAIQQALMGGDPLLLAGSYGGMGKVYLRKGEYDKALEIQQDYLKTAESMGDKREIGQAYLNLGGVYFHMTDYPKAIIEWENCLGYMEEADDKQGITNAYNNLGVANEKIGQYESSLKYHDECIILRKKIGDVRGVAMVYNNIGVVHQFLGKYEQAIENYKKSLEIRHKIGDVNGIANAYNNLGTCHYYLEKYMIAIEYYKKYLDVVKHIKDIWGITQAYNNLSEAEMEIGEMDKAKEHCEKAMKMASKHSFKDISSSAHKIMGVIKYKTKCWEEAFPHFEKSILLSTEIGEPGKIGMANHSYGLAYLEKGDLEKAYEHLNIALKTFEKAQMKNLAAKTKKALDKLQS